MIDAIACERHFIDHLAAVWFELPERGTFYVPEHLVAHARSRGLDSVIVDVTWPQMPGTAPIAVASWGDLKRVRKAGGRTRIAYLEHGAGQSYGGDATIGSHHSYAGGAEHDDVDLFLVPNDHAAGRWRAAYPQATVEIVGSPIIDTLPAREPGPPVVAVGFHWDCRLARETTSAIHEFAPVLGRLARRFTVIGTGHPRRRELAGRYARAGIRHVADFRDVCREASLYVADNSSTLFEFAALDRPVVVLNARRYRRDVEHGLRFWSAASVGLNVDRPEHLGDVVEAALADPPEQRERRDAAVDLVYQPRSGGAARAAAALARFAGA